jgi:nicotinamidase-related amidase
MFNIANVKAAPSPDLLTPDNSVMLFVDHQPQMFFGTGSGDRGAIINATVGLAKAAKAFNVPAVLTTVAAESFSGPLLPQLAEVFPGQEIIDRTTMNAWEDSALVEAVRATGRRKIILSGLWTEVCLVLPALSALGQGYEVYVVADASGGVTPQAHEHALQRMINAGAVPVTWIQVLLELQRDWARGETYGAVMEIVKEHGGAYGLGVVYAQSVIGAHAAGCPRSGPPARGRPAPGRRRPGAQDLDVHDARRFRRRGRHLAPQGKRHPPRAGAELHASDGPLGGPGRCRRVQDRARWPCRRPLAGGRGCWGGASSVRPSARWPRTPAEILDQNLDTAQEPAHACGERPAGTADEVSSQSNPDRTRVVAQGNDSDYQPSTGPACAGRP